MSIETLTGNQYLNMVRLGASKLGTYRKTVNDLNVFPIPDGDTGDNMFMTICSGRDSAAASHHDSLALTASTVSSGMLYGARGNSGVILSRIFSGIARGLGDATEADLNLWKAAMLTSVEEAYRAVAVPVEGTILTVLKTAVHAADNSGAADLQEYFRILCAEMSKALDRTPDQLDVLKKAGVVDSGGAGLVYIFEGMLDAIEGRTYDEPEMENMASKSFNPDLSAFTEDSELEFGYCTEFLLRLQRSKVDLDSFDESVIKDYLESAGESLVFFRDGSIIKVHVHTRKPGDILNRCQQWGEYLTIKVENMTLQHHENHMKEKLSKAPHKATATVVVASGEGIARTFRDMGADGIIEGGQTMNPSADSFVKAFSKVNADRIFVFPNNSNVIMTAGQAASLYKDSKVYVIPTKTVGAGYAVLGSLDFSEQDSDALLSQAEEVIESVTVAMVSRAVRDTEEVRKDDYMGFVSNDIICSSTDRQEASETLCENLDAASFDVILAFKGKDVPAEEAEALRESLESRYRRSEVIMIDGGQPVFDYIFIFE